RAGLGQAPGRAVVDDERIVAAVVVDGDVEIATAAHRHVETIHVGAEDVGVVGAPAGDADVFGRVGQDFVALAGGGSGRAEKAVHSAAALDVPEFDVGQVEGQYVHVGYLQDLAEEQEGEQALRDPFETRVTDPPGRAAGACAVDQAQRVAAGPAVQRQVAVNVV